MKEISKRVRAWVKFATLVYTHIEDYTVPQYGDEGDDQLTGYTPEDCIKQIQKYANRAGRNVRSGQDQLDLLKIAHYAQVAFDKLEPRRG